MELMSRLMATNEALRQRVADEQVTIRELRAQLAASQALASQVRETLEYAYNALAWEFPESAIENIARSSSQSAWRARLALKLKADLALTPDKAAKEGKDGD